MATLIHWYVANPVYAFGGLVGLALGIFYGFDGWRGDTADLEFQNSPRVKNLLWILGGGFVAFFGDTKALDPKVEKPLLLLAYFLPCLVAGILVVAIWGFVIGVGRVLETWKGRDYGYSVADALGDYFFYGYRYYRRKSEEARENRLARFHVLYLRQLTLCVAAAVSADAGTRMQVARSILQSIAAVVKRFNNDDDDSMHIRANLMCIENCDDELRQQLIFVLQEDRPHINRCLRLIAYDTNEGQPQIVLPVADTLQRALPGAPCALLHPAGIVVIDDTSQITYSDGIAPQVRNQISAYFGQNLFRSFGSLRIFGRGTTLGVVNVDARVPQVFGRSDAEKERIANYLLPFATTLGVVLSNP